MASTAENSSRSSRPAARSQPRARGASRPLRRDGMLHLFYAGQPVPCPVGCGGSAEVVRVGTADSGAGELWLECASCAQRRRYEVPRAGQAEKRSVSTALRAGRATSCPRHSAPVALAPRGRQLVCPACGVVFRD